MAASPDVLRRVGEEAARRAIKNELTAMINDFDSCAPHRYPVDRAYVAELRKWRRTIRIKQSPTDGE